MNLALNLTTLLVLGLVNNAIVQAEEVEAPSLELLEFIGSFETENGKWVDPLSVLELTEEIDVQLKDEENKNE